MTRTTIVAGVAVAIVLGLAITGYLALKQSVDSATPTSTAVAPSTTASEAHPVMTEAGTLAERVALVTGGSIP